MIHAIFVCVSRMCNLTNAQGEDKRTAGPEAVEGSERECYILCKVMENFTVLNCFGVE